MKKSFTTHFFSWILFHKILLFANYLPIFFCVNLECTHSYPKNHYQHSILLKMVKILKQQGIYMYIYFWWFTVYIIFILSFIVLQKPLSTTRTHIYFNSTVVNRSSLVIIINTARIDCKTTGQKHIGVKIILLTL